MGAKQFKLCQSVSSTEPSSSTSLLKGGMRTVLCFQPNTCFLSYFQLWTASHWLSGGQIAHFPTTCFGCSFQAWRKQITGWSLPKSSLLGGKGAETWRQDGGRAWLPSWMTLASGGINIWCWRCSMADCEGRCCNRPPRHGPIERQQALPNQLPLQVSLHIYTGIKVKPGLTRRASQHVRRQRAWWATVITAEAARAFHRGADGGVDGDK